MGLPPDRQPYRLCLMVALGWLAGSVVVPPSARADTLTVGTCVECIATIQAAIDSARHGDEIAVESGVYFERLHIYPSAEDSFYITLRAEDDTDRPRIEHAIGEPSGEPTEIWENYAVVEIHNDMNDGPESRCRDMRVTIENLEIVATDDYTGALSVWTAMDDVGQEYNTGLFLRHNYFQAQRVLIPPRVRGAGALWIGRRPDYTCLPEWRECLEYQSLKWGAIEDNEIITINGGDPNRYLSDGISTFHFVGKIENNRVTGTAEGVHMSFARLGDPVPFFLQEPPWDEYASTIIQHNLLYCNEQTGIHFTHGSLGTVRNNIVARTWYQTNSDASGIASGRSAGASNSMGMWGSFDIEAQGDGGRVPTIVDVFNNTVDWSEGYGIAMDDDNNAVLLGNIVSRTRDVPPLFAEAQTAGIAAIHGAFNPDSLYTDYNVLWGNREKGQIADYSPVGVYPAGVEGVNDVTESDLGGSNPHYWRGSIANMTHSYMLKTYDPPHSCYGATSSPDSVSRAIDAGPTNPIYNDVQPPGLGGLRNDAGAYGGPFASWGDEGCLEYKVGNNLACCTNSCQ